MPRLPLLTVGDERVLHVLQGAQHSQIVLADGLLFPRGVSVDVPPEAARREDGPADRRPKRKESAAALKEIRGFNALQTSGSGEIELRKQLRLRLADACGGGSDGSFRAAEVGPAPEQVGRQAGRHFRRAGGNG